MAVPQMSAFSLLILLCVAAASPSRFLSSSLKTRWPSLIWFKQGDGSMKFDSLFDKTPKSRITAAKLILATSEKAANEATDDKKGMLETFGEESQFEIYVRPDYTKLSSVLQSKQSCTRESCKTDDVVSYLQSMLAKFTEDSGLMAVGVACQQEEGFNPLNSDFKCPELMVATAGKYKFLQIESGYGCYSAQKGSTLSTATTCDGETAEHCVCPEYHLEEKTYEPYVIGGFKPAPGGNDCKNNIGHYCCTYSDSPGGKCPGWDVNNQCFLAGDTAASEYGKLIGKWWKSDASFTHHPDGHVSCIGVGNSKAYGNANCAIDTSGADNAAAAAYSLKQEIGSDAKGLCFY